jgi:hypothetical protein
LVKLNTENFLRADSLWNTLCGFQSQCPERC